LNASRSLRLATGFVCVFALYSVKFKLWINDIATSINAVKTMLSDSFGCLPKSIQATQTLG
jgi:hypothetical protein